MASVSCVSIRESSRIESRTLLSFEESQESEQQAYALVPKVSEGRLLASVSQTPLCQNIHIEERKETRITERSTDGMLAIDIGMALASGAAAAYFLSTSSARPSMPSGPMSNELTADTSNTLGALLLIHGAGWGAIAGVNAYRARDSVEELPVRRIETPGKAEPCGDSSPAPGVLVTLEVPADQPFKLQGRTNAQGVASFQIPAEVLGQVPEDKAGSATVEVKGLKVTWSLSDIPAYAEARRSEADRIAKERAEQEVAERKREASRQAVQANQAPAVPEMSARERKAALRRLKAKLAVFVAAYGDKATWRMRNRSLFGVEHSAFLEHGMTDYGRQRSHYEGLKLLDDGATPWTLFVLARNTYKSWGKQDGALALREALGFTIRDAEVLLDLAREAQSQGFTEHDLR